MLSTNAFLEAMVPLYIMAAIGFATRKKNILTEQANHIMTNLMLYITLPALILFSLDTSFSIQLLIDLSWLVAMSIFIMAVSIAIAAWLRKKSDLPSARKNVYESLIIFGNQGFIGFAIIYIMMGEQGIIYLTLFNICYLILIWTYGIHLFTRDERNINLKFLFLNPGILATLIGVCMVFLPYSWPEMLLVTLEDVGKMTIPLSMLLIGSLLAEIRMDSLRNYSKDIHIWIASLFKLIILPLCLLVFLFLDVPYTLLIIAVVTSSMPSASTTSIYAQKFGADASYASFGVILSTLLCIITIPLLYSIMQWLHGLLY